MSRPTLLDLFCGAGGAARGYQLAGFHVTGVDVSPQPHYCGDAFIQADALTVALSGYDVIHASPPCQGYSVMRHLPWLKDRDYPLLIAPIRQRLAASGVPWVIENVMGAQRAAQMHAGWLCGGMFGLPVLRHRVFQTNWPWLAPGHPQHRGVIRHGRLLGGRAAQPVVRPNGFRAGFDQPGAFIGHSSRIRTRPTGTVSTLAAYGDAIGIDWMTRDELSQAIPPAYTAYLGGVLRALLEGM
jgi:DNA (cytosine-5)-methyltransferase 1